jgi:hypothetical protein
MTASKNCHWRGTPPMVTVKSRSHQQGMRRPSAPARLGPEGGAEDCQGIMENAKPVSTR